MRSHPVRDSVVDVRAPREMWVWGVRYGAGDEIPKDQARTAQMLIVLADKYTDGQHFNPRSVQASQRPHVWTEHRCCWCDERWSPAREDMDCPARTEPEEQPCPDAAFVHEYAEHGFCVHCDTRPSQVAGRHCPKRGSDA